ncbi:DUF6442 family protein [Ruminococcus albus]|uniref:DUF6442 family protein n=1 Tax=Ruminococcus albus TaxID=1264 RepID=UPI00046684BB|nr:DUF6442 family protein [Ruminococcus albus]
MDKERVLAMSRKENEYKDPYTMEIENKANLLAGDAMLTIVSIIFIVSLLVNGEPDYLMWSIVFVSNAFKLVYSGIKLKDKKQLRLGIGYTCLFLMSFIYGIIKLIRRG